jgi:hypothetical protein
VEAIPQCCYDSRGPGQTVAAAAAQTATAHQHRCLPHQAAQPAGAVQQLLQGARQSKLA